MPFLSNTYLTLLFYSAKTTFDFQVSLDLRESDSLIPLQKRICEQLKGISLNSYEPLLASEIFGEAS